MKLHLPKSLFVAVLAATVASTVWAESTTTTNSGWGILKGEGGEATPNSYYIGDAIVSSINTADTSVSGDLFLRSNAGLASATVTNLSINSGDTLKVDGWYTKNTDHPEFTLLTIDNLVFASNSKLVVEAGNTVQVNAYTGSVSSFENNGTLILKGAGNVTDIVASSGSFVIASETATVSGKLYSKGGHITLGDGTTNGIITVGRVELSDKKGGDSLSLNVKSGYTLKVTGSQNAIVANSFNNKGHYKTNSFIVSEWENSTTMNIEGSIMAEDASMLTGDREVVINIENGGTLAVKGLGRAATDITPSQKSQLNLKSGGRLILGDMGVDFGGNLTAIISGGTIGIAADNVTISEVFNITGEVTLDTAKYSYEENALTQVSKTGSTASIDFSNGIVLADTAKLTIQGGGTVSFGASPLAVNNTITVLDGSKLELAGVTVNIDNWDSNTSDLKYYDSRGEGAIENTTGNGFGCVTYLLFDGYEWNGVVSGYTTSHTNGDTYLTESSISGAYYINNGEAIVDSSIQSMSENYMLNGGTMKVQGISLAGSDITIASNGTAKGISLSESGSVTDVTETQFNSLTNVTIGDKSTFSLRGFTTAADGLINASKVGGTGILELKLKKDNGINFNLSNFEGDIVVKKDTGEDSARLQLNKSTFHENATIVLAENGSDIVINGKDANNRDYVLTTNVEVKGNSTLHLNGSNKATITSTITGAGTLTKAGSNSALTLNGTIQVSDFKATSGTTNVIGGTVSKLTSGATTNISGGSVSNMVISAGSVNISGGSVSNITYTAGGTVNFKLAEGKETASFTVENVLTSTKDEYGRHMNVAKGVTLNATTFTNQWGMGTLDVDGILNAESLIMTSGGHGENNNVITGDGVINLDTLVITNAGTYRFKAAEINIDKEVKQDKATMNLESGVINLSGTLNMTGGTFNMIGGTLNLTKKEVNHKFSSLDMAGNNNRDGHLKLAADVALEVGTNFWLGGTSTIALAEGATLTKDGMTITGSEKGALIDRLTSDEGGTDNAFKHESTSHEVNDGHVTISKQSDSDLTLGLKLTNSSVTNESSALLKVTNAGNTLNGVIARGGSIALQNVQAALSLDALEIAAGKSVTISGNEEASNVTVTQSASFGAGSRLDANLTLKAGTKVTMGDALTLGNDPQQASEEVLLSGDSTVTGYTLSLEKGLTLQGNILKQFDASAPGSGEVILFSGVDTLKLGGVDYNALTDVVKLSDYFRNDRGINFEDYYIGFNANGDVYAGLIVPEPTTATLSLLALAGLCARRRRASR